MGAVLLIGAAAAAIGFWSRHWLAPALLSAAFIAWDFTLGWSLDPRTEIDFGLLLALQLAGICLAATGVILGRARLARPR